MPPVRRARGAIAAVTILLCLAVPAAAFAAYGAIAINPHTGAWGIGYNASTKRRAESVALKRCSGNCRVVVWVRNGCAAVVVGPLRYVSGIGSTKASAIAAARRHAHHPHAPLRAWTCSG